jgi:hypothetical protein
MQKLPKRATRSTPKSSMAGRESRKPKSEVFYPQFEATCLCGRMFLVGYRGDGVPTMVHELPLCRTFIEHNSTEYIFLVRQHLSAKARA